MLMHRKKPTKLDHFFMKIPCVYYLHAVTSLHVLHLDVLKKQIEMETESNILMYDYNAGPHMAIPIYTVLLYCVVHTRTSIQGPSC